MGRAALSLPAAAAPRWIEVTVQPQPQKSQCSHWGHVPALLFPSGVPPPPVFSPRSTRNLLPHNTCSSTLLSVQRWRSSSSLPFIISPSSRQSQHQATSLSDVLPLPPDLALELQAQGGESCPGKAACALPGPRRRTQPNWGCLVPCATGPSSAVVSPRAQPLLLRGSGSSCAGTAEPVPLGHAR